jgi:hypothetical protein
MKVPKPHILSIHPTMACDHHCFGCYLKRDEEDGRREMPPEFFIDLVKTAAKVGIQEIAVPANYKKLEDNEPDMNLTYYSLLKDLATSLNLEFTCTANYDFLTNYIDKYQKLLDDVSLMSVSINDYSTSTPQQKQEALDMLSRIKRKIPTVNCNLLISPNMVKLLKAGLMKEILDRVDTVYLLVQKPLIVPMDTIKEWLSGLEEFFDMIDDRVILDSCLKSAFGLTDGICSKHQLIYVNPYGDVKHCSYDAKTMFKLEKGGDLAKLYQEHYPQQQLFDCKLLHYAKEGN